MAQKSERKRLTDRLDDLCREIVRLIHNDCCYQCHTKIYGQNSHPHHIVAKGKGASWRRFDLRNLVLLCFTHHRLWHDNPTVSQPWWKSTKLHKTVNTYLDIYRNGKPAKISTPEMRDLKQVLKRKLKELQGETK